MDWALHQAREENVVVSGFHSPLEQSVLKVVLARPVGGAKLPSEWANVVAQGTMAVVSAAGPQIHLAVAFVIAPIDKLHCAFHHFKNRQIRWSAQLQGAVLGDAAHHTRWGGGGYANHFAHAKTQADEFAHHPR